MKQSKSTTNELPVEKQNKKENPVQNSTKPEQKDKPSWGAYYLMGSFAVGTILLLLKVLGVL